MLTGAGGVFEIDGVRFCLDFAQDSTAALFSVKKPADLVNRYPQLVDTCRPERIVEFGIAAGGSTALLYALAHPSKLVAFELNSKPVEGLAEFIDRRGLETRVRPCYGIDQAEPRVSAILDDEFGDEPIDLVIDDASHLLAETRATFEMVFPRVRPGGAYVIRTGLLTTSTPTPSPESPGTSQGISTRTSRSSGPSCSSITLSGTNPLPGCSSN